MPWQRSTPAEPETIDRLAGSWHIHQLKRGHRFSTDDVVTAWLAVDSAPDATKTLDLGAGIGSVGLMALYNLPAEAHLTMVEAQEVSHRLALRTVALNEIEVRVRAIHADIRDETSIPEPGTYQLVTGSPPYIPPGSGIVSQHSQRAHARFELRGDVFDYCLAAARALAPGGTFCFCHAAGDERPERAIEAAGLALRRRFDVRFRAAREPTIALFEAGLERNGTPGLRTLTVRDADGEWTEEYRRIRDRLRADG